MEKLKDLRQVRCFESAGVVNKKLSIGNSCCFSLMNLNNLWHFVQRFMLPVKKMVFICRKSDTIRRKVKERYCFIPHFYILALMLQVYIYLH